MLREGCSCLRLIAHTTLEEVEERRPVEMPLPQGEMIAKYLHSGSRQSCRKKKGNGSVACESLQASKPWGCPSNDNVSDKQQASQRPVLKPEMTLHWLLHWLLSLTNPDAGR